MTIKRNLEGAAAVGYAVGQAHGKFQTVAQRLAPMVDANTGKLSEANEAGVKQGLTIYRCDTDAGTIYHQTGADTYSIPEDELPKNAKTLVLSATYAMGFTSNDVGKLKGERPNLHALVAAKRKAVATYVSNTYRAALAAIKVGKGGERGPRGAARDWIVKLEDIFADRIKAAKVARKRGDTTVPDSDAKIAASFAACLKSFA